MADLPIAPVDRLIRKFGAERVSEEAAVEMAEILSKYCGQVSVMAAKFATHAGRKTVFPEDIKMAIKAIN